MKLTVVGCAGSFPGPDSPASCYLVEAEGFRLLLDLGSGAIGALARYVSIYDIDAVLLSHLHPDHCMDLCGYYVARNYRPEGPSERIPVYGPADTADRMATAYGLPLVPGMRGQFDFRTLTGEFELGPFRVGTARMAHPVEAYGFRLGHAGKVLTYSGDTGECDALVALAEEADLLLCEASFQVGRDEAPGIHLNGAQAAAHANAAAVGRLLLTHIPPWYDPARALEEASGFVGPLELARPGAVHHL
jgi:ribonuclease BN (tRNA processing enzyme)